MTKDGKLSDEPIRLEINDDGKLAHLELVSDIMDMMKAFRQPIMEA